MFLWKKKIDDLEKKENNSNYININDSYNELKKTNENLNLILLKKIIK